MRERRAGAIRLAFLCPRYPAGMNLIASIAVTKQGFPAYNRDTEFQRWNSQGFAMSSLAASDERTLAAPAKVIQPAWVRVLHWINAVAIILMIMSGWQIYNASPLFDFTFSHSITLGGWLGGALLWHFAAMWLLMVNGLVYLALGLGTGRLRQKLPPITPSGL